MVSKIFCFDKIGMLVLCVLLEKETVYFLFVIVPIFPCSAAVTYTSYSCLKSKFKVFGNI
jgi:hypothetical protein